MAICRERQRLLDAYGDAAADFIRRGRAVADVAISYEADLFQRTWQECEAARIRCAELRHDLTAHMQEHGCLLNLFTGKRADGIS